MLSRALLVLFAFLLPLAAGEGFLRLRGTDVHELQAQLVRYAELQVMHPEAQYLMTLPSSSAEVFGHPSTFNSLGMRDPEPRVPKPPGTFRVLLLGDSVTFGQGVAQESIYPSLLRERLRSEGVEIVAAGVPGWNTLEEERFLRANLDRLAPDLVLLMYVANDREPDNPFRRARMAAEGFGARIYRSLVLHSRLFEWAVFVYRQRFPDTAGLRDYGAWMKLQAPAGEPFAANDEGWQKSAQSLLRINAMLQQRNARLVLFAYRVCPGPPWQQARDRLFTFGPENGIPVVDVLPFVGSQPCAELVNRPMVDPHPNALSHGLIADGILRTLRGQKWLPGVAGP